MNHELRRVDPLRAANILGLAYGMTMLFFAVLTAAFFLILEAILEQEWWRDSPQPWALPLALTVLIVFPATGLALGWLWGLSMSTAYNLVVRLTGGLLFKFTLHEQVRPDEG
jgi:hypothetical protein